MAEIPTGEFVGELSYFAPSPASATVVTAEESRVLVIPHNRFEQILDDNPKLVRAMLDELATRLQDMDERFSER